MSTTLALLLLLLLPVASTAAAPLAAERVIESGGVSTHGCLRGGGSMQQQPAQRAGQDSLISTASAAAPASVATTVADSSSSGHTVATIVAGVGTGAVGRALQGPGRGNHNNGNDTSGADEAHACAGPACALVTPGATVGVVVGAMVAAACMVTCICVCQWARRHHAVVDEVGFTLKPPATSPAGPGGPPAPPHASVVSTVPYTLGSGTHTGDTGTGSYFASTPPAPPHTPAAAPARGMSRSSRSVLLPSALPPPPHLTAPLAPTGRPTLLSQRSSTGRHTGSSPHHSSASSPPTTSKAAPSFKLVSMSNLMLGTLLSAAPSPAAAGVEALVGVPSSSADYTAGMYGIASGSSSVARSGGFSSGGFAPGP